MCVLQELRAKANGGSGEARANAAEVFRILDVLTHNSGGSLKNGVHLKMVGLSVLGRASLAYQFLTRREAAREPLSPGNLLSVL